MRDLLEGMFQITRWKLFLSFLVVLSFSSNAFSLTFDFWLSFLAGNWIPL